MDTDEHGFFLIKASARFDEANAAFDWPYRKQAQCGDEDPKERENQAPYDQRAKIILPGFVSPTKAQMRIMITPMHGNAMTSKANIQNQNET